MLAKYASICVNLLQIQITLTTITFSTLLPMNFNTINYKILLAIIQVAN